ncbi:MAG: hypothetical protein A3J79_12250 [Elusimicrobia bacterium RIFOXYB2_FULL_62_6]|nr:MAG: hypothetical protein A3J79_12250 [Elusimicrobia bacterium RIFOXYB2_FULL_62_6]
MLDWTAPAADGFAGAADAYEIRLSTIEADAPVLSEAKFWQATPVTDYIALPSPAAPGTAEQLVVPGLEGGTTYYFAIRARAVWHGWGYLSNGATAQALVYAPEGASPSLTTVFSSSFTLHWTTSPFNCPAARYIAQVSTDSNFNGTLISSDTAGLSAVLTALAPNSTNYARVYAYAGNNASAYAALGSTITLAGAVSGVQVYALWTTSAAVNWQALPVSPSSASAEGYLLEVSTDPGFTPLCGSSATADVALSTLTVENLAGGKTYYFRAGSLNWTGRPNFAPAVSAGLDVILSLSILPTTYAYGEIYLNTSTNSATNLTITNTGNVDVNFSIKAATMTPGSQWLVWDSPATAPAHNKLLLRAVLHDTRPGLADYGDEDLVTGTSQAGQETAQGGRYTVNDAQTGVAVPAGQQRKIWLRLDMPVSSYSIQPQALKFTIEAAQP